MILASAAMDDSIEWRSPLEEIRFVFIDFSGVGSHWRVFWLSSQINPTLDFYPFARISLGTWSLRGFCSDSLNLRREFGIVTTSLCHVKDIG